MFLEFYALVKGLSCLHYISDKKIELYFTAEVPIPVLLWYCPL